jgi:hypothetical protein
LFFPEEPVPELSLLFQDDIREPDGRRGPESDAGASVRDRNEPDGHGIVLKKQRKFPDGHLGLPTFIS